MLVGLGLQVIVLLLGVPFGALAGFVGGRNGYFCDESRFIET
jgi:ABC-type microcin C transport system permease subunit YejE